MVYWAAVFIMTRRLTRYENRENLAEGVGFELGHRSRQARALNKKDQASRLSSISSILLNHPVWGRNVGKMSGKMRALAVTSAQRWPTMPEVPTMAEAGLQDFVVTSWAAF